MRRSAAFMTVAGIMVLSLGFAAPAQALETVPGAPQTLSDVKQAVPSSVIESLADDPDQKGYNAKFANMTKYYGGSSASDVRKERFRVPVQGAKKLAVGTANGAMAVMGTQFLQGLTTSGISAAAGIDTNAAVCTGLESQNLSFVSIVFGYACGDVLKPDVNFAPNSGQPVTYTGNLVTGIPATVNGAATTVDMTFRGTVVYNQSYYKIMAVCAMATQGGEPVTGTINLTNVQAKFPSGYATNRTRTFVDSANTGSYGWRCGALAANVQLSQANSQLSPGDGWTTEQLNGGVVAFGLYTALKPLDQTVANPPRTFECTITMTDGTTVKASSASFTEKDATFPAPSCPALPEGKVADSMKITEVGGGETKTVSEGPTTTGYKNWATQFPQCVDGSCQLDLVKITNGTSVSCFSAPEGCANWLEDPAKTENYQCTYAGTVMALTECNIYGPTFNPGGLTTGQTYGDPKTGQAPSTPSTTPQDHGLYKAGVEDATKDRQCFPSGYDQMNPVQWVMQPVQCAIEWAFVPTSTQVKARMAEASSAWNNTPMAKMRPVMAAWGGMWPSLDGCQGPKVTFSFYDVGGTYYPLDACKAPLDGVATASRVIGAVGMYIGACLAITRYLGATFGYTGLGSGKGSD